MLLRTHRLTKDYGAFRALDQIDLEVAPGEIFGLLGPNGSGKSTALRLLMGFLRPTHGHATIGGFDCWQESVNVRRQVGYLPGELRLYENMTGRQLVRFLSKLRQQPDSDRIDQLAQTFDIDVSRPIANLSSGMKRKVALLLVLLPRPPLLILDEPTNTLDPTMRDELMNQLLEAREHGQTVLFSSHVLAEVERVCDRVGILQRGRLVHLQKMSELNEVRRVRAVFSGPGVQAPDLPALQVTLQKGNELHLEYGGPLPGLLTWLAKNDVRDLKIEPLGLARIYRNFHGA